MKRSVFQLVGMIYLAVNGVLLLPANMMYFFGNIGDYLVTGTSLDFFLLLVGGIALFDGYYYMLGLGFVHIALNAGFAIYTLVKFVYTRDWLMFVLSAAAVAFSVWSNVFLLQH